MTQTTLELGAEMMDDLHGEMQAAYACQKPLLEYIDLGAPGDTVESQVIQWVKVRGPVVAPDDVGGYPDDVAKLWQHITEMEVAKEEFAKCETTVKRQTEQIESVKASKSQLLAQDDPRMVKLQVWATEKLEGLKKQVTAQKTTLSDSKSVVSAAITDLVKKLQGLNDKDSECDDLFAEVEKLFGEMTMEQVDAPDIANETSQDADVVMDATTLALEQCKALPDGPQKSAILAVLQTAMASKAN